MEFGSEIMCGSSRRSKLFYIPELIDPRVAREKDNTTIISVVSEQAFCKQIEQEFMGLVDTSTWRWNARQLSKGRFVMRFPNAPMLREWSRVKALAMNEVDAFMKVEPWTARIGAKGVMQQASLVSYWEYPGGPKICEDHLSSWWLGWKSNGD